MIASHFFRSSAKLSMSSRPSAPAPASDSITSPAEGEADQPFCGAEISTSTPDRLHIHPDTARGDAVQHQQRAHLMRRLGQRLQVIVRQDDPGRGLDMRRKDHVGLRLVDLRHHLLDRRRRKGRLGRRCRSRAPSSPCVSAAKPPASKIWRPAIGKPAVAHDQRMARAGRTAAPPPPSHRCRRRAPAPPHRRRRPLSASPRYRASPPETSADIWFSDRSVNTTENSCNPSGSISARRRAWVISSRFSRPSSPPARGFHPLRTKILASSACAARKHPRRRLPP